MTEMADIIGYTWWHPGEKNLVAFNDCSGDDLFEDLDCEFDFEVSDGIVNVPDKVLESLGDVEAWAEHFRRPADRGHQRPANQEDLESKTKPCAQRSPPPLPSTPRTTTDVPGRKKPLGLLRLTIDIIITIYNEHYCIDGDDPGPWKSWSRKSGLIGRRSSSIQPIPQGWGK